MHIADITFQTLAVVAAIGLTIWVERTIGCRLTDAPLPALKPGMSWVIAVPAPIPSMFSGFGVAIVLDVEEREQIVHLRLLIEPNAIGHAVVMRHRLDDALCALVVGRLGGFWGDAAARDAVRAWRAGRERGASAFDAPLGDVVMRIRRETAHLTPHECISTVYPVKNRVDGGTSMHIDTAPVLDVFSKAPHRVSRS